MEASRLLATILHSDAYVIVDNMIIRLYRSFGAGMVIYMYFDTFLIEITSDLCRSFSRHLKNICMTMSTSQVVNYIRLGMAMLNEQLYITNQGMHHQDYWDILDKK